MSNDILQTKIADTGLSDGVKKLLASERLVTLSDCKSQNQWRPTVSHGIRHVAFHAVKDLLAEHGIEL